jgi:hypothetical protein
LEAWRLFYKGEGGCAVSKGPSASVEGHLTAMTAFHPTVDIQLLLAFHQKRTDSKSCFSDKSSLSANDPNTDIQNVRATIAKRMTAHVPALGTLTNPGIHLEAINIAMGGIAF